MVVIELVALWSLAVIVLVRSKLTPSPPGLGITAYMEKIKSTPATPRMLFFIAFLPKLWSVKLLKIKLR
jgi:hypothetical protein